MLLNLYCKYNLDTLELPKLSNAPHVNFGRLNLLDKELSIIICIKCSRFGPSNPTLPHSISSCWRSAIIFRVKDSIISRPRSSGCCWHHLYCLAPRCYVFYSAATQHSKEKQAFIFFWREAQDTHFYSTFVKRTKQRFSYSVFRAPPQLLVRRNLPFKSSGH